MSKYVTIRVVSDDTGNPMSGSLVGVWVHQALASGLKEEKYTNSSGEASFDLDVDSGAEITIYVDHSEKASRQPIRGQHTVYA